jgi:hypothetical protein
MTDLAITASAVVRGATANNFQDGDAGATIAAGQMVYRSSTTNKWLLADSNSATAEARTPRGMALNSASDGQPLRVQLDGPVTMNAVLTAGITYYQSDTPGGICPVADVGTGEYSCIVGIAASTTSLLLGIKASGVAL